MAQAMIGGLLKSSLSNSLWSISVAEPYEPTRQRLAQLFPGSLLAAVANSTPELLQLEQQQEPSLIPLDAVVLAVKPQTVAAVCGDIKAHLLSTTTITTNTPPLLVISIAAGVSQASIAKWLDCSGDGGGAGAGAGGRQAVVVRCMPNTPALVNQGATGLFSPESSLFSPPLKSLTESILRSVSPNALYWLTSENLIDVVTGLSGKDVKPDLSILIHSTTHSWVLFY